LSQVLVKYAQILFTKHPAKCLADSGLSCVLQDHCVRRTPSNMSIIKGVDKSWSTGPVTACQLWRQCSVPVQVRLLTYGASQSTDAVW